MVTAAALVAVKSWHVDVLMTAHAHPVVTFVDLPELRIVRPDGNPYDLLSTKVQPDVCRHALQILARKRAQVVFIEELLADGHRKRVHF